MLLSSSLITDIAKKKLKSPKPSQWSLQILYFVDMKSHFRIHSGETTKRIKYCKQTQQDEFGL